MSKPPIDNSAIGLAWTTLDKVFQRAKQHHGKDAKEAIKKHLLSGALRAHAGFLRIFESEDAFEFPNIGVPPHFANNEWREREEAAYLWATNSAPVPDDGSVQVVPGERYTFVWTGISVSDERGDAIIPFRGNIEVHLQPEINQITLEKYITRDGMRWPGTRYRADSGYRRYEAKGVRCLRTEVDAVFPYSTEHATRRRQARPVKFPFHEADTWLQERYGKGDLPPTNAEMQRALGDWYAGNGRNVGETTLRNLVKQFRSGAQKAD